MTDFDKWIEERINNSIGYTRGQYKGRVQAFKEVKAQIKGKALVSMKLIEQVENILKVCESEYKGEFSLTRGHLIKWVKELREEIGSEEIH